MFNSRDHNLLGHRALAPYWFGARARGPKAYPEGRLTGPILMIWLNVLSKGWQHGYSI